MRSISASAIASSASFLTSEPSAASLRAARLAAAQISATDVAVTVAMVLAYKRLRKHEIVPVNGLVGGAGQ